MYERTRNQVADRDDEGFEKGYRAMPLIRRESL